MVYFKYVSAQNSTVFVPSVLSKSPYSEPSGLVPVVGVILYSAPVRFPWDHLLSSIQVSQVTRISGLGHWSTSPVCL